MDTEQEGAPQNQLITILMIWDDLGMFWGFAVTCCDYVQSTMFS